MYYVNLLQITQRDEGNYTTLLVLILELLYFFVNSPISEGLRSSLSYDAYLRHETIFDMTLFCNRLATGFGG